MSTHNIQFFREIRKISIFLTEEKKKSTLSGAVTYHKSILFVLIQHCLFSLSSILSSQLLLQVRTL